MRPWLSSSIYLPDILLYSDCILFADDTVLYLGESEKVKVYSNVQLDLDAVYAWCNNNQITLNQAETEYIKFSCWGMHVCIPAHYCHG